MSGRRGRWLSGLALGLLALFAAVGLFLWLYENLVQRSEEVYTGFDEIAARNPFYTAERLLTQLGRAARGVRRLSDLPQALAAEDTLLVAVPTYVLSAAESRRLLDWVERGGHLIVSVRHEYAPEQGRDPLLNHFAVRSHAAEPAALEPETVVLDAASPPLQVRFQSGLRLNEAFWQQYRWGQGRVTLLTDIGVFSNIRLLDHDHADFLWALSQQNPNGQIWLQYRMLLPSLAQLLWRHAWMPLLGLTLTLLAVLWRHGRRLGPVLVPRADEQRRLAEHLQASSRFLWRHGAGPTLVQAARHYTLRRLDRHHAGLPPAAAALDDSDQPLTERELVHTLQTLQRLHRHR
ncbi:MAG: DUF4350 domain-containing protein [Candidatus Competibacteraceae bacterium]